MTVKTDAASAPTALVPGAVHARGVPKGGRGRAGQRVLGEAAPQLVLVQGEVRPGEEFAQADEVGARLRGVLARLDDDHVTRLYELLTS